jgi:adenylate kinase family enzyme
MIGEFILMLPEDAFQRINVTGNAGSGKTTLAKNLGQLLTVSVIHFDQIVWQPNWQKTPLEIRQQAEEKILNQKQWIIDGVSRLVREQADLVLFLDTPAYKCTFRAVKRTVRHLFKQRPELPENCPEYRIIPYLFKLIWRFPKEAGAEIRLEAQTSPKYRIVKTDKDIAQVLHKLRSGENNL